LVDAADETAFGPLYRLAVLTGMRRGEILVLRRADVDLAGAHLSIQQTAQRNRRHGIVFRPPKTRRCGGRYWTRTSDFLGVSEAL
jgi:integrase